MTLLDGRHVSSDVAVVDGEPRWWRHVTGEPAGEGTFDYWTVHAARDAGIEDYCGAWIGRHLAGYTGILNIETIGGRMIEVHLRMSDQWPDLYGAGWVEAVVRLYQRATMGVRRRGPARRLQRRAVRAAWAALSPSAGGARRARCGGCPSVSSVQITFHEDKEPEQHAMPPGGFRLAVVNAPSLQAGLAGRELLRAIFSPVARCPRPRGLNASDIVARSAAVDGFRAIAQPILRLGPSSRPCYKAPPPVRE